MPLKAPVVASYALMCPLPKLPTSRSPPKAPQPAGAISRPHGELSAAREISRVISLPVVE